MMLRTLALFALLSMVACQPAVSTGNTTDQDSAAKATNKASGENPTDKVNDQRYGTFELRVPVAEDHPEASAYEFEEQTIFLGNAHTFEASFFEALNNLGKPALGFEVIETQKAALGDLTESLEGQSMAMLVDGKVLTMPNVNSRLAGSGIIEGGASAFSEEMVRDLLANFPR